MMGRMTISKYQKLAQRTSPDDGHDKIDNGVLGLIGETGELVDVYKKWQYQSGIDATLPAEKFSEELGDVLWYLAELAAGMDKDLGNISVFDFPELDNRAARGNRQKTIRSIVTGLSNRANRINNLICHSDAPGVDAQIRWMLMGCARLAWAIGTDLRSVAHNNIVKLRERYPKGFDAEISMGRYER